MLFHSWIPAKSRILWYMFYIFVFLYLFRFILHPWKFYHFVTQVLILENGQLENIFCFCKTFCWKSSNHKTKIVTCFGRLLYIEVSQSWIILVKFQQKPRLCMILPMLRFSIILCTLVWVFGLYFRYKLFVLTTSVWCLLLSWIYCARIAKGFLSSSLLYYLILHNEVGCDFLNDIVLWKVIWFFLCITGCPKSTLLLDCWDLLNLFALVWMNI